MNELMLQEISTSSIYGTDCKYDDSFLLIEQEIDKDYSVTQEGNTDWKYVVENSQYLLIEQTKDVKLASWWFYGYWKENSWNGLIYGLNTYVELLGIYSKGIFPISKKAKINILLWLEDALTNDIISDKSCKLSIDDTIKVLEFYKKLYFIIEELVDNNTVSFKKIINYFDSIVQKEKKVIEKKKEEKVQESVKVENKSISEKSFLNQENTDEITSDSDVINLLRAFKKKGSLLADYYRKKDIGDLKALRITRLLTWLETDGLPFANDRITFLNPPSVIEIDELENLYKNKEYEDAFYLTEEILEVSPFWIDGHYHAFNILEKTKNFDQAREVKNTLASFINTNESILDYRFADDSQFASNKTKKWIEENFNKSNTGEMENNTTSSLYQEIDSIYELANENKLDDAMVILQNNFDSAKNMEEKFNWRLNHAELAIEFEKKDIALALLEELEKDIDKYHLYEWNPTLTSRVYTLLLTSFSITDIDTEKIENIYKKLCKTDISSALKIKLN